MLKSCPGYLYLRIYFTLNVLSFLILTANPVKAQFSEIGFSLGGTHYSGDLVRSFQPSTIRPGGSVFYRKNISEPVSVRFSLSPAFISGSDKNPIDAFAVERDASFSVFLLQADASIEYHFLDFKSENAVADFSPYLALGVGMFFFTGDDNPYGSYSKFQPVIPLGLGMKYLVSPRVILGIEYSIRKTFFDYLDNVSEADMSVKNYQYGNWYNDDWHYFLGISFSYAFYDIPCPYRWK